MKRYTLYSGFFDQRKKANNSAASPSGEWVPAEVAQALYDALQKVARRLDANDCDEWTLHALKTAAFEALSLADGEE